MNSRRYNATRKVLAEENKRWPKSLVPVPPDEWPAMSSQPVPVEVWRSRDFLVQIFNEGDYKRLTINRTAIQRDGRWQDGITWDDLQRLKRECGFGRDEAVEVYPPDDHVVDDANMRHLWVLPSELPFSWRRRSA